MVDYASNTHKSKERNDIPEKKVEAVVDTPGKIIKKSTLERVLEDWLPTDRPSIKDYIYKDVLIPTIKRMISNAVDMILYGTVTTPTNTRSSSSTISYNSIYSREPVKKTSSLATVKTVDYGTIAYETKAEAFTVLEGLQELIDQYNIASVNDLYDLSRVTGDPTSANWGWTNIDGARVENVNGVYVLRLPKARPIN